jgi:electron-transferring-flavoprotein dehydrogenase
MKSGILAADAVFSALSTAEESTSEPLDLSGYQTALDSSWVMKELNEVRNLRPSFHSALGNWGGIMYSGIDSMILKGRVPWTFHHPGEDSAQTKPAS